jgi:hypothetical protein
MCEAVEDLARDEATQHPDLAVTLLRAARAERTRRGLPQRQRDAEELAAVEQALTVCGELGPDDREFRELVDEMTA